MAIETPIETGVEYFPNPTIGRPVFNGSVYIGIIGLDPKIEVNRITVTVIEEDGTRVPILPAAQPLLTGQGGVIIYSGKPVSVVSDQNYSIRVDDSDGNQIYYVPFVQNIGTVLALVVNNYDSVASVKADLSLTVDQAVTTASYVAGWAAMSKPPVGGASYNIVTVAEFTAITGLSPDEFGDHTLDNGLVAMLRVDSVIDVTKYGAKGDNLNIDTSSCRAAKVAIDRYNVGVVSSPSMGSRPTMFFPSGQYIIDDFIVDDINTQVSYFDIVGENSILKLSPGVICFGGIGYVNKVRGMQFLGGAVALSMKNSNVDSTTLFIDRCQFADQTTSGIITDAGSASFILVVTNSKFIFTDAGGTGHCIKTTLGDELIIDSCWMTVNSPVAIYAGSGLKMTNCDLVPRAGLLAWVDNYTSGTTLSIDNVRFGGELGGRPVVRNYADIGTPPTVISITNSAVYSTGNIVEFYKLPNQFIFENNSGLITPDGWYFDPAITTADFSLFAVLGSVRISSNQDALGNIVSLGFTGEYNIGTQLFLAKRMISMTLKPVLTSKLKAAHIRGSCQLRTGWTLTGSTAAVTQPNDEYGLSSTVFTATADSQEGIATLSTYLDPTVLTPNILHTFILIMDVIIGSREIAIQVECGRMRNTYFINTKGKTVISLPFVYLNDTGTPDSTLDNASIQVRPMLSGDEVRLSRAILVEGMIDYNQDIIVQTGTASPGAYTSGTGVDDGYIRGDISYRSNVAASGFIGDVNTIAGTPGTWKTFGPVSA